MTSTQPPNVSILPIDQIFPFEERSAGQAQPPETMAGDVIRNPFLVTPLNSQSYLLLEDAEGLAAAVEAGLVHVPVQVCREAAVRLAPQTIELHNFTRPALHQFASRRGENVLTGPTDSHQSREWLSAEACFVDGYAPTIWFHRPTSFGCPASLRALMNEISTRGHYHPAGVSQAQGGCLLKRSQTDAVLSLPPFDLADMRMAAGSGQLFPPGIVAITADCRAVSIDFPLSVLTSDISTDEKQAFLEDMISMRQLTRRTTVIEGRVYILNR